MRYCSTQDAIKEVSRYAMNDYLNLGYLWRMFIQECPNIPEEALRALAQDEKWDFRWAVARRKQDIPEDVWELLSQDKNSDIRWAIEQRKQDHR